MALLQVIRLESQAKRYKQAAENSEKLEDELKGEKRKLQREVGAWTARAAEWKEVTYKFRNSTWFSKPVFKPCLGGYGKWVIYLVFTMWCCPVAIL